MGKVVLGRRLFLLGSASVLLTGCVQTKEEKQVEQKQLAQMADMLVDKHRFIESFETTPSANVDGVGRSLYLEPNFTSPNPVTPQQMDALLRDIWFLCPFEPVSISLTARDAATGKTSINLYKPTSRLPDLVVRPYGDQGAAVTNMDARYGPREEPANG